jgi:hypothetical protein
VREMLPRLNARGFLKVTCVYGVWCSFPHPPCSSIRPRWNMYRAIKCAALTRISRSQKDVSRQSQ